MTDVANHIGVSRATVSYAFTSPGRLSPDMLSRVRAAVDELGYVRNTVARQLRVGRSQAIAFIVSNASNPHYGELALGAGDEAARTGHVVLIADSHENLDREREFIAFFAEQRVAGIMIAPIGEVPPELLDLQERGTPFVLVGVPPSPQAYPSISGDNVVGGYLATRHLIDQGRRRLLVVGGTHLNVDSRREGARRALAELGGEGAIEFIEVERQTAALGEDVARRLLARGRDLPDGIFAGNDLLALGMLNVLIKAGVAVPEQVSLVGYDDIEFAGFAIVPLTTIRHPSDIVGASGVRMILGEEEHSHGVEPRFAPKLVIRGTSLPG
ncbi:MAG: LacI family DNA-binding transcriptional regulator [Propionicimonas sp.]|nr:LacI family DNA-binding transcriptional regulator [Propionicimonas sp.]